MKQKEEQKAKKNRVPFGRMKVFIFVCVLVYASITFVNQQSILNVQYAKNAELAEQEASLQRELAFYQNELSYIGSDEYVEQRARGLFGYLYPDETQYIAMPSDAPVQEPVPPAETPESQEPAATTEPDPIPTDAPTPTDVPTE